MISQKYEAEMQSREPAMAPPGHHTEFCVMAHHRIPMIPGLERIESFGKGSFYTKLGMASPPGAVGRLLPPSWSKSALIGVKSLHSLIYFSIEFCMGYLLYAGLKGREDRRSAIAAGVVAGESIIFVGNRFRCPLTGFAKKLGAASGSVIDIYLPGWLASNLVAIHIPLLALALGLHARNFLRRRSLHARVE